MAKKHKKRGTILEVIGAILFVAGIFYRTSNSNLGIGLLIVGFLTALVGVFLNTPVKK